MSEPATTGLGLMMDVIEEAKKRGWLDKLLAAFKKRHEILVLGSTGAGKTNFLDSLRQALPEAVDAMPRTEFVRSERLELNKKPFLFVDTPGQIGHQPRRIAAVRKAMKRGVSGVINVVSYRYHKYRVGKSEALDRSDERVTARASFLERHRAIEIEALNDWKVLLGGPETTGWLLTVVTKADLWWDRHDEVMDYYKSGLYNEALGEARQLKPVVMPYCSVFKRYFDDAPMTGLLDDADRARLRANLIRELITAVSN